MYDGLGSRGSFSRKSARRKYQSRGAVSRSRGLGPVERLEDRMLLAISVELDGGTIPRFQADALSNHLTLRAGNAGLIEYSADGSPFSSDLDSDAGT